MMRKCHAPDTLVATPGGAVAISTLREGDEVYDDTGAITHVTAVRRKNGSNIIPLGVGEQMVKVEYQTYDRDRRAKSSYTIKAGHKLVLACTGTTPAVDEGCGRVTWWSHCNRRQVNVASSAIQHSPTDSAEFITRCTRVRVGTAGRPGVSVRQCNCGGVFRNTRAFGSAEAAKRAVEILRSPLPGAVDPYRVLDGDVVVLTTDQFQHGCTTAAHEVLKTFRVPLSTMAAHHPVVSTASLPLDPYMLGLWLGNGSVGESTITSCEPEVKLYMERWAASWNAAHPAAAPLLITSELLYQEGEKFSWYDTDGLVHRVDTYLLKVRQPLCAGNAFNEALRGIVRAGRSLFHDKSVGIPSAYFTAPEADRLALIAGLLDSDGTWIENHGHMRFSQCGEAQHGFVKDIVRLATSCGIGTTSIQTAQQAPGYGRTEYIRDGATHHTKLIVKLTHGCEKLRPHIQVGRKKPPVTISRYTHDARPIKILPSTVSHYVSMEVAGGRFLLADHTVTHNCHLNTCPVGIATQDPELRMKFSGQPEHVVNFFFLIAEEVREYMAQLGFRKFADMVGRVDMMEPKTPHSEKTKGLDLSSMLVPAATLNSKAAQTCVEVQDHGLTDVLDRKILARVGDKLASAEKVQANFRISNVDRTVGAILSNAITQLHGLAGLPDDTIHLRFKGSAGQSFGAWLAPGVTLELNGDSNDYVGKGLSGGRLIIYPPKESMFKSEENVIVGNVCLYGATAGSAFFRGRALQRFGVRNSGANAVVEGVGDHGCEYMTGGIVVILGSTGRNFAAGMSGGIAYVYDPNNHLAENCNRGLVQLEHLDDKDDTPVLERLIDQHRLYTGSSIADRILWNWEDSKRLFVKVIPTEYKAILDAEKKLKAQQAQQSKESAEAVHSKQPAAAGAIVTTDSNAPKTTAQTPPLEVEKKAQQAQSKGCGTCNCGAAGSDCAPAPAKGGALEGENDKVRSTYEQMYNKAGEETEEVKEKSLPIFDASGLDIEEVTHKPGCPSHVRPRPIAVPKPNKKRGFIEYDRGAITYREVNSRLHDFKEIYTEPIPVQLKTQAARCMDCGVPFCHDSKGGCPLGNKIPEWNDLVFRGMWKDAIDRLLETNNFPEFTGRACPAPCEGACVLGINEKPVTIKNIENSIIERAWKEGWMVPRPPKHRTGKRVAVVGSGPAGLAVADQLNKAGHSVVVYERADRAGGLLMYGVPNMKLDKRGVVDRRIDLMRAEGVEIKVSVEVGPIADKPASSSVQFMSGQQLMKDNDVLVLTTGATRPRDLQIPGRELKGIEYAMDFLTTNTKSYLDSSLQDGKFINAKGKRVLVIGGGDTGNDCIGTSVRHGAKSVLNFELLPIPTKHRAANNPWPQWPRIFRVDYGHEEAKAMSGSDPRQFSVLTKRFLSDDKGNVRGVDTVRIRWDKDEEGRWQMTEIDGTQKTYACDLVLLAMGFTGPEGGVGEELGVELDEKGNFRATEGKYRTTQERVFTAGDCRRGQSLIVWAIAEGRQCAREIDRYLMGSTVLP